MDEEPVSGGRARCQSPRCSGVTGWQHRRGSRDHREAQDQITWREQNIQLDLQNRNAEVMESIGRIRRNSKNLLQDLISKGVHAGDRDSQDLLPKGVHVGDRDTPIPAQSGRDSKMIHSIASLIRGKSKLLLLESPDTVEIYKLDKQTVHSGGTGHAYLPALTAKASNLSAMRGTLSQSCPYLYNKRRGSFSSVGSQKTGDHFNKKSNTKALKEAKKSNVTVTMTYLGHGHTGTRQAASEDELKVLQQVNGGENLCVFKGTVTSGEQFQFVSKRHRGYPFSATLYVNGMMAARISSCCEYRYAPGFQQGKKSCFRLTWLSGGMPCYRCTSLRNKYSSCQQLNNGANENLNLPADRDPANVRSCPSSPLFLPGKPEKKKSVRRTRSHRKESGSHSTDSEDPAVAGLKDTSKPKRRKGPSNQREDRCKTAAPKRREEGQDTKGSEVLPRTTMETADGEEYALHARHQKTSTKEDQASHARQDQAHRKTSTKEDQVSHARQDRTHQKTSTKEDQVSHARQDQAHRKTSSKEDQASYARQDRMHQKTSTKEDQALYARQDQAHHKPSTKVKTAQKDHQDAKSLATVPDSLQEEEALSNQNGEKKREPGADGKSSREGERRRDFYEECVEMNSGLEAVQNKQTWFKANILERCRLQKKLSSCPKATSSDVEHSEESETNGEPDEQEACKEEPEEPEEPEEEQEAAKEEPEEEQDLQAQLDAMMTLLNTSDEVEQLVLRNTDLTDDLLLTLVGSLKSSPSEVKLLNLNLNRIGPYGAVILLDLMRAKPQVKGLLLFGNQLRDHGIKSLLSGLAELQEQTRGLAIQQVLAIQAEQHMLHPEVYNNLQYMVSLKIFALFELDIGGNGLGSDGLRMLASYMRHHSHLRYLGLAQTSTADLVAWKELFDSLIGNGSLMHIILDESNLGDPGVRLLADVLRANASLTQVDLDRNGISDVGGNDITAALLCRTQFPLRHLSLEENDISAGLMSRIKEEVRCK